MKNVSVPKMRANSRDTLAIGSPVICSVDSTPMEKRRLLALV